jgi:hypothetical protein
LELIFWEDGLFGRLLTNFLNFYDFDRELRFGRGSETT